MKDERGPSDHIKQIIRFCDSIKLATERFGSDEEDFLEDELYQNSCCFALVQIGESIKYLRDNIALPFPEIDWKGLSGMRDIIAHSYHRIVLNRVWKVITEEIPVLRSRCEMILNELKKA